jgi:hypothetical protein
LDIRIERNLIAENVASGLAGTGDEGVGVWLFCTSAVVRNNTIVGNVGGHHGNLGAAGIVLLHPGTPIIDRNIVALSPQGGGILCKEGTTPQITNNLFWGNGGPDAVAGCIDWIGVDGNTQADPLFCGAGTDDFTLATNSPGLTHPAAPLGSFSASGCDAGTLIEQSTWSRIKARWPRP